MNLSWPHIHLLLNHFPIVGAIAGILLFIAALIRKSRELKLASYWTFILMAGTAIVVFYSGTEAAHAIEELPQVGEAIVHRHREVAEWALIALTITGALGLAGVWLDQRKRSPSWFVPAFLIISLVATGLVSWAGMHGGTIRHPEVRGELDPLLLNLESFQESSNLEGQPSGEQAHSE